MGGAVTLAVITDDVAVIAALGLYSYAGDRGFKLGLGIKDLTL